MATETEVELFDAGIDWLSFTTPRGAANVDELKQLWRLHQTEEVRTYGDIKETAPQGYRGIKSRHWFYGEREGEHYFQTTSAPAREAAECLKKFTGCYRVTRCDYQATFREPRRDVQHFARYREQLREREKTTGRAKRATSALYESDSGGDSIVFNSRTSKRILTIYDKSAESKGALGENLTRYELRTRHQQAKATFAQFRHSRNPRGFSMALVADMMRKVGFPVEWPEAEHGTCLPSSYEKSDEQRRFDWLMGDVMKTVAKIEDPTRKALLLAAFRECLL